MKRIGQLKREFFGGDVWVLTTPDGATFQLLGEIPGALEGQRVEVEATAAAEQFGIAMVGEMLQVLKIRKH